MKREFRIGKTPIEVEELDRVVAVKAGEHAADVAETEGLMWNPGELAEAAGDTDSALPAVRKDDLQALKDSGWTLVRAEGLTNAAFAPLLAAGPPWARARVFRDAAGRLMLGNDHLTIRLRDALSEAQVQELFDRFGLTPIRRLKFARNLFEVRVARDQHFLDVSSTLAGADEVMYAEPQFIEHFRLRFKPTDPDYALQWHLNNTGQNQGTLGADLDAERAWDETRGAGMRIALLDNGFDVAHPDLKDAITPRSAFFDLRDESSATFRQGPAELPGRNHGTQCAGIAVARAGNGVGGCGVAHEAQLMALACVGGSMGNQTALARAISYAADPRTEDPNAKASDGADVISCSLGPDPLWLASVLEDAFVFATSKGRGGKGTPIFWATDNEDVDIAQDRICAHPLTIAVARSTNQDGDGQAASGHELDFVATGVDVYTTDINATFRTVTGTSLAAPAAAGVAALVLAANPGLHWLKVREIMRNTCEKVGGVVYDANGHNDDFGFGRVNAADAVHAAVLARSRTSGYRSRRQRRRTQRK
jgi:subtilisin family serine protease